MTHNYFYPASAITQQNIPLIDFHLHTSWTDGKNTVNEMYKSAVSEGLNTILFTEHVRKGSESWFNKYSEEIKCLPQSPCRALVGAETKVLDLSGTLDIDESVIKECHLLMGVVHRFPGEDDLQVKKKELSGQDPLTVEFNLAMAILDNSDVDILGHPLGMTYRRFKIIPDDNYFQQLAEKAAVKNIAFEINPHYYPDPWRLIEICCKAGTQISFGSNAHNTQHVGRVIRVLKGDEKL